MIVAEAKRKYICQHCPHPYLAQQRFQVAAKLMKHRASLLGIALWIDLLAKAFELRPIGIHQKLHALIAKLLDAANQRIAYSLCWIIFRRCYELKQLPEVLAQLQRLTKAHI